MSSAQSQSTNISADSNRSVLPEDMGLEEVMRVVEVASTLRKEQELVEREFNIDKTKELLRDKLRKTAELTGENLTAEQVEAAVNWYYDNLHEYEEPEKSLNWYLAHLYVARTTILSFFVPIALAISAIWAMWFAPFAPFSTANKEKQAISEFTTTIDAKLSSIRSLPGADQVEAQLAHLQTTSESGAASRDLVALQKVSDRLDDIETTVKKTAQADQEINALILSIRAIAKAPSVLTEMDELQKEAEALGRNLDVMGLEKIRTRLKSTEQQINEEFVITVVGGENQRSATRRDFEDESGKRVSGYYLIVQARDQNGRILKRNVHNIETDKSRLVDTWGEKVPKAVYDRLKQDKQNDGVLNETKFAEKLRGELEIRVVMPGEGNQPILRGGQITDW